MADKRIQCTEELVGAGHTTKTDTINRLSLVEHNNDGTHKASNIYTDIITKGPVADVRAFLPSGFVIDGSVDYTTYIQAAIDYCLTDPRRPKKLLFPIGRFLITSDLVIKVKEASVNVNWGQFQIEGQGGGSYTDSNVGTSIICTTSGTSIFRICEESDGSYPGGGAGVVTTPLNYLRRVHIAHMNFMGDSANPTNVNGIVGRGIYHSNFYRCGFYSLNYGIRLGKAEATAQETSSDGYELDYCEQNVIERCTFKNVETQLSIMAGDITTIEGNLFSTCPTSAGRIFRFVGGQDFYNVKSNIIHPYVNSGGAALTKPVQVIGVRGYKFRDNHIEGIKGNLVTEETQASEVTIFEHNLLYGPTQASTYIFNLYKPEQGLFVLKNNNIAMPQPSVVFINTIVAGGGSLANVRHDYYQNRATTTLGGTTAIGINSNSETSNLNLGRWGEPAQIGRGDAYIWKHTSVNKLYVKYGSKPTTEGDGVILGEDAYIKGTMAFPGITVNAGSYAKADINVSGMGMDLSRFIQLAPDVELGIDAGTGYLNWSCHYFNNGGTPTLRIVFQNPTATGVTLAAGTWKYRVMLN